MSGALDDVSSIHRAMQAADDSSKLCCWTFCLDGDVVDGMMPCDATSAWSLVEVVRPIILPLIETRLDGQTPMQWCLVLTCHAHIVLGMHTLYLAWGYLFFFVDKTETRFKKWKDFKFLDFENWRAR